MTLTSLLFDRLDKNPLKRTKQLYALNGDFLSVDIIAYTREEFLKALKNLSPPALDAISYGNVLYDDGFYKIDKEKFEELKRKGLRNGKYWMINSY
ncbi:hypothetical protein PF1225 [Pyrococcus furiosus DSM 3638]|uniref:Uncharacterized protein n=1 Tax=Pyrococcus furiosus (strain ATCC 43587 / DSM 3638 / JCM 8422 / Vc1) TaxID=186497 RepID=Q8U1I2_PYRFU|nr:hypothetical protein PF1225 [Pyrococcus furiosus DSM 3638]